MLEFSNLITQFINVDVIQVFDSKNYFQFSKVNSSSRTAGGQLNSLTHVESN